MWFSAWDTACSKPGTKANDGDEVLFELVTVQVHHDGDQHGGFDQEGAVEDHLHARRDEQLRSTGAEDGIAIQAVMMGRGPTPYLPRRLVGGGFAAFGLALVCLCTGSLLAAATCVVAGVVVIRSGTRLALR